MKNFINFDAFTLVECVMDRIVNNYSEAELLCNVLDEKEYAHEAKEMPYLCGFPLFLFWNAVEM